MTDIYKDRILELQIAYYRWQNAKQARKQAHRKAFEDLLMSAVEGYEFTPEDRQQIESMMEDFESRGNAVQPHFLAAAYGCTDDEAAEVMEDIKKFGA